MDDPAGITDDSWTRLKFPMPALSSAASKALSPVTPLPTADVTVIVRLVALI
jgi:hypothetical protein